MNVLIADSGSTKTEWAFCIENKDITLVRGAGMNPYFCSDEDLQKEILSIHSKGMKPDVIFFYGAGCSNEKQKSILVKAFRTIFPEAEIHVDHDMLGAARALCGEREGIACILGTGSNSCHFDGRKIIAERPALGYVLGDEGAGSQIGKALLQAHLYSELPASISDAISSKYAVTKDSVLDAVYKKEFPNRYLASFSVFVGENQHVPEIRKLAKTVISNFADRHLLRYSGIKDLQIHFTGSVAAHFEDILQEILDERGLKGGKIEGSPMQGLINFHQKQG